MQRIIKFRAWHPVDTTDPLYKGGDMDYLGEALDSDVELYIPLGYTEIMEFTGLKDKNGVEIYEGDIISTISELMADFGRIPTGKYQIEFYSIEYCIEDGRWLERRIRDGWLAPLGICQKIIGKYSEVIGNIYENPKLLKAKDE